MAGPTFPVAPAGAGGRCAGAEGPGGPGAARGRCTSVPGTRRRPFPRGAGLRGAGWPRPGGRAQAWGTAGFGERRRKQGPGEPGQAGQAVPGLWGASPGPEGQQPARNAVRGGCPA